MTTVANAVFNGYNRTVNPASASGAAGTEADPFARLLENLFGKDDAPSAGGSLMEYLSRGFSGVNFSSGSVGDAPADVQDYFGSAGGDNVAIEPGAAEAIAGNAGLSRILDSMLAAFQETAGQTEALEGAHVQRNIMITRVTVRFSVSQIDSLSGETLSMNELKSAFTDTLQELARNFFGGADADSGGTQAADPQAEFFNGGFAFNFHFSAGYLSSRQAADAYASGGEFDFSALDFQAAFAARGNFQNYASSTFSSAILSGLMAGSFGEGPFTSMLDSGMGMFGMTSQSSWQAGGGYSFQFGRIGGGSGNLLAELMSLYNSGGAASGSLPGPEAPAGTPEPAPIEDPAEAAALA